MAYFVLPNITVATEAADGEYFEWQATPPTKPGLYWARNDVGVISAVMFDDGDFLCFGNSYRFEASDFVYWLGPLPEPEPPKT